MNISLSNGSGDHPMEPDDCNLQGEIDEHIQIMQMSGHHVGQPVMLLADPEYPGAYRVWTRVLPGTGTIESAEVAEWMWVTPDGEVIRSRWPWAVTD